MSGRIRAALLAAFFIALAPSAGEAKLYKYVNEKGEVNFTNDLSLIPESQRGSAEEFSLEKELPTGEEPMKPAAPGVGAQPRADTGEGFGPEPVLFSRAVSLGAQVVTTALLPLGERPSWIIEEDTGLIELPKTLKEAESRARPYLRMLLLFAVVVIVGMVAGVFIRRFQREGVVQGLASFPLFQVKGALFGVSVFAGGFFAWLVWHGAQLDWQRELSKLWDATGGALTARTGVPSERLEVELSDGTKAVVESPVQLVREHDGLVALLLAALAKAEEDVEFLEQVCSRQEGADNPGETVKRLLKMREILDDAERKEDDLRRFRRAAARRGFSLGPDPIEENQEKFRALQQRLQKAQADCAALSLKGHKVHEEALDSVR